MNTTGSKSSPEAITPAVHLEFIQNQLENGSSSVEDVEKYHRSLFLHHHAIEWEKHRQQARIHEDRLRFLESRLQETQLGLSERTQLVPVTLDGKEDVSPSAPWNAWDMAMFAACSL